MSEKAAGNTWVENFLRPVLIAGMVACLAAPAIQVLEWLFPGWTGGYFLVFVFLASLEAILSERVLQARRMAEWEYLLSRLAEIVVLLVLLKLANYIPRGFGALAADARLWLSHPETLATGVDFYTALILIPLWMGSIFVARVTRDLDIEQDQGEPPQDKTSTRYYLWLTQPSPASDRQERLEMLSELFGWGGVFILLLSVVLHLVFPETRIPVVSILLFFALGIILLSQGHFSVTYSSWRRQGIPIQAGLGRRWLLWSLVFLVGIAIVVLVLPTRYTMGPVRSLLGVYNMLIMGLAYLVNLLMYLLSMLMYLILFLLSLLFPSESPPRRPDPPEPMVPPQGEYVAGASPPWLDILGSALFWLIVLSIMGYALSRFLRDRLQAADESEEAAATWWGRLLLWLRALWREWLAWRRGAQARLEERRAARRAARAERPRSPGLFSLRRLSPRQLVRYFYLSMARRAEQAGMRRGPGQTPYEYRAELDGKYPDLEPDLEGLTDAFVAARYSPGPVEKEDAEAVKPLWQRIKAALRRRRLGSRS